MDFFFVSTFQDFYIYQENQRERIIFFEKAYILETKFPLSSFFEQVFQNLRKTVQKEKFLLFQQLVARDNMSSILQTLSSNNSNIESACILKYLQCIASLDMNEAFNFFIDVPFERLLSFQLPSKDRSPYELVLNLMD